MLHRARPRLRARARLGERGLLAERVDLQQVKRAQLSASQRAGDRQRVESIVSALAECGAVVRQHTGLAQPTSVARRRDFQQPGSGGLTQRELRGEVEQRAHALVASGPRGKTLAPQDHELLTGLGKSRRGLAYGLPALAGAPLQLHAVPARALAQAQIENRCVDQRVAVEHEHAVRELEVRNGRLQARVGQLPLQLGRQRAVGARVHVGRAECLAQHSREQKALLVGRTAAGERGGRGSGALEHRRGLVQGTLPGDWAQLAAVAQQRL